MNIFFIGDSIRKGYQPFVEELLGDAHNIEGPEDNCGDSANIVDNIDRWLAHIEPDIIHFNCGLHDLRCKDNSYQVPLDQYTRNLHTIADKLQGEDSSQVIWVTTTPVIDNWHNSKKPFERHDEDVQKYNDASSRIISHRNINQLDLYDIVVSNDKKALMQEDGVHFTEKGYRFLGKTIARKISHSIGRFCDFQQT